MLRPGEEHLLAENPEENGIFVLKERTLVCSQAHIQKKNPTGKSGAGAESPQDTWPGLPGDLCN